MTANPPARGHAAGRGWRRLRRRARQLALRLTLALVGTVTPLAVLAAGG
ncbi:MAG: hypothetical protein KF683_15490 [Rubrivivax sp.]|nr:hypothetical protein [Rubrivivax sp.]